MTSRIQLIEKIADIWVNILEDPSHENGDNSTQGMLIAFMDMDLKVGYKATKRQLTVFKRQLVRILLEGTGKIRTVVDYHPCKALAEAAEMAGINESLFSIKTRVSSRNDRIYIKRGYSDNGHAIMFDGTEWVDANE